MWKRRCCTLRIAASRVRVFLSFFLIEGGNTVTRFDIKLKKNTRLEGCACARVRPIASAHPSCREGRRCGLPSWIKRERTIRPPLPPGGPVYLPRFDFFRVLSRSCRLACANVIGGRHLHPGIFPEVVSMETMHLSEIPFPSPAAFFA